MCPSGSARATKSPAMAPSAPGRFSTSTGWPRLADRLWPTVPRMRSGGVAAVSENGVLGDPTTATADAGAHLFAQMVADCLGRITRWEPDGNGMLR